MIDGHTLQRYQLGQLRQRRIDGGRVTRLLRLRLAASGCLLYTSDAADE